MLELNHIYNMDCVEGMQIPNDLIDLTVTSPHMTIYTHIKASHGF